MPWYLTESVSEPQRKALVTREEESVFGIKGAAEIIAFLRDGARSYNAWVTIIDDQARPNPGTHGCSPTCIVLDADKLTLNYRFDYYMYGQFMKFIRPGAVRIHSDGPSESLPNIAVRNPDGTLVVVVPNPRSPPMKFNIEWAGRHLAAEVDGTSVATFRWPVRSYDAWDAE